MYVGKDNSKIRMDLGLYTLVIRGFLQLGTAAFEGGCCGSVRKGGQKAMGAGKVAVYDS